MEQEREKMPVLKSPKQVDHPAEHLSKLIPEDIKGQFLRTPKQLLIENPTYAERLKTLRNHFNYSYLVQWIYLLKHVIKLSDAFDVENLEEELLGIAPPTFLNSLKSKLIQFLKNEKLQNIDMEFDFFVDQIYQDYNLIELNEEQLKNEESGDGDDTPLITYSKLPLLEQIDVLYNLAKLSNTKSYANFRKVVDKFEKPQLSLKIHPIYQIDKKNTRDEYIILQDARLYLRKWEYTNLSLPMNKDQYDSKIQNPYEDLQSLEPTMVQWECLTAGIYEYDNLIKELKKSFGKKTSSDEYALSKRLEENIDFIVQHDLKKRKQGAQRKREIEMQLLMANRKRSSRLEEKERRKKEEEEKRMKEFELIKQQAAEMRAAKRQKLKESMYSSPQQFNPVSREERLKKRHEMANTPVPVTASPEPSQQNVDNTAAVGEEVTPSSNQLQEATPPAAPNATSHTQPQGITHNEPVVPERPPLQANNAGTLSTPTTNPAPENDASSTVTPVEVNNSNLPGASVDASSL